MPSWHLFGAKLRPAGGLQNVFLEASLSRWGSGGWGVEGGGHGALQSSFLASSSLLPLECLSPQHQHLSPSQQQASISYRGSASGLRFGWAPGSGWTGGAAAPRTRSSGDQRSTEGQASLTIPLTGVTQQILVATARPADKPSHTCQSAHSGEPCGGMVPDPTSVEHKCHKLCSSSRQCLQGAPGVLEMSAICCMGHGKCPARTRFSRVSLSA